MPKRTDLHSILLIGSGPIVIGQACEFDYSGVQACKALREEGYRVLLVNSNPATIMTDPEFADATYIEPLTPEVLEQIIVREQPDALLPTIGGQTGLNLAVAVAERGVLLREGVELIGARLPAIKKAEDRSLFHAAMQRIGLDLPCSRFAYTMDEAVAALEVVGLPAIIRSSFTLGGTGGAVAYTREEFEQCARQGLDLSPIGEILVEESILGWKEFELEVMRDMADNVVIVCSIENFDPMGVHTGDSITVAPAQTLTDKEYQRMRDAAIAIIREIGVDTGGSNIQFAVQPETGRMVVIEMNPRVSRSSALASKATGFPIAKIAAKLAVGYRLDEIRNDITQETPASFEPTIDYCVTKIPRWAFEKFPGSDPRLTIQMKSVGEVMSIGRTFKESLQKGLRSLETDRYGFGADGKPPPVPETGDWTPAQEAQLREALRHPTPDRIFYLRAALRGGMPVAEVYALTKIDPWFLQNLAEIIDEEAVIAAAAPKAGNGDAFAATLRRAKELGYSDVQLAHLWRMDAAAVRKLRQDAGIHPTIQLVDTCAAEFAARTPYYYSTYGDEDEVRASDRKTIMILGSGPNRIGQGVEFDYCCVHAAFALREAGYETIMVNSNPETVSTDYDTSDKLYFEPLTLEDVLNIVDKEQPDGVIVQFGGQTPLNLAVALERAGVPIIGTSPQSIDRAEDRELFKQILDQEGLRQPDNGTATSAAEAVAIAQRIGYPVVVRPSYVLGGRAMEIVFIEEDLRDYMGRAVEASPDHPVLIDRFLEDAIEVDVDALADGTDVVVGGIMEHIELAGVHSGDSACVLPPISLSAEIQDALRHQTAALARALNVVGLVNIQFAIQDGTIYVLEVNPRASRTVPFVSKATGRPLAKIAARIMAGATLRELGVTEEITPTHYSVKEAVLPFNKFAGVDILLGPEMKSTGEVMGMADTFGLAFAKSQLAAGQGLPTSGRVFISVNDRDKPASVEIARRLVDMGLTLEATQGTQRVLAEAGLACESVLKVLDGQPNCVDHILNGDITLVINTPLGRRSKADEVAIRRAALERGVPIVTTLAAARAACEGIHALQSGTFDVKPLQDYHPHTRRPAVAAGG